MSFGINQLGKIIVAKSLDQEASERIRQEDAKSGQKPYSSLSSRPFQMANKNPAKALETIRGFKPK